MDRSRRGVTVVEVLISLLLGLGVLSLGWSGLARQRGIATRSRFETDLLSAQRITSIVMGKELRATIRGRDWSPPAADSLSLRAYRGWAAVCGSHVEPEKIVVSYQGERSPNPDKDSLAILTGDGWRTADLIERSTSPDSCPAGWGDAIEIWTIDPAVPHAVVARVFERGSYHLSAGAFRYRRGFGGRQPLTPDVFDGASSGLGFEDDRVVARLVPDGVVAGSHADTVLLRFWTGEAP